MAGRRRIVFDTSGINALGNDPESALLLKGVSMGFGVRLTETNISEIIATSDDVRRLALLDLCKSLVTSGEVIVPYHEIICRMSCAHRHSSAFDWRRITIRRREIEEELARCTFIADPTLSQAVRSEHKTWQKEFSDMWRDARLQIEDELRQSAEPITLDSVFESFTAEGNPLWRLAANLYARGAGQDLDAKEVARFLESCPPMNALLAAICVGQYHWGY